MLPFVLPTTVARLVSTRLYPVVSLTTVAARHPSRNNPAFVRHDSRYVRTLGRRRDDWHFQFRSPLATCPQEEQASFSVASTSECGSHVDESRRSCRRSAHRATEYAWLPFLLSPFLLALLPLAFHAHSSGLCISTRLLPWWKDRLLSPNGLSATATAPALAQTVLTKGFRGTDPKKKSKLGGNSGPRIRKLWTGLTLPTIGVRGSAPSEASEGVADGAICHDIAVVSL